ncbi:MAG: FliM/FliN family flagellar motor switch protein [Phycisphaerales bacterium]|nr:FliM/FliN family flagellar motor switch protein [Phycisphaerales bacterium]
MKTDLKSILALEVPLVVVLGERTIALRDVISWVPGSIFEIPKSAEEDLDIRINDRAIGLGSAVKIGENFGIRVNYIGNPKQRILAMGEQPPQDDFVDESGMSADEIAMALLEGQL